MKRQDYYPSAIEEQVLWLRRFANSLPAYADVLRLGAAALADAIADALWVAYTLGPWRTGVRAFARAATSAMEAVQSGASTGAFVLPGFTVPPIGNVVPRPAGALKRIFGLVRGIKASPGYTEAIGRALGVLTITDDRVHSAPSLEVSIQRGAVNEEALLKMEKWDAPALFVEGRRGGGGWEQLAITLNSSFTDRRPLLVPGQPEIREYRACFYADNVPAGEWSPVVTVTVSP